jgi:hypothetical protein
MPAKKAASTAPSGNPPPAKKAPAKKVTAKKAPAKKAPAKKATVKAGAPAEPAAPAEGATAALRPTRDQITHAAYLNFLRRKELGLPGDPATDWITAERQLVSCGLGG